MKNFFFNNDESDFLEISLTPLIDTVLVLLIIFILVSPSLEHALKISLPQTKYDQKKIKNKSHYCCIAINQHGKIFLKNKQLISLNTLLEKLKKEKEEIKETEVIIYGDKDLLFEKVIEIIDAIKKKSGIEKIYVKTKKISF